MVKGKKMRTYNEFVAVVSEMLNECLVAATQSGLGALSTTQKTLIEVAYTCYTGQQPDKHIDSIIKYVELHEQLSQEEVRSGYCWCYHSIIFATILADVIKK